MWVVRLSVSETLTEATGTVAPAWDFAATILFKLGYRLKVWE
jgi:hypothetical protein